MLGEGVVEAINDYTISERSLCAFLKLDMLVRYEMLVSDEKVLKYGGVSDDDGFIPKFNGIVKNTEAAYMLIFTKTPGNAKYEVYI
uniref:Uncharacterized protein n=1 Tax=Panagrolaimus sp. ES5 TaxID=591445 RepID=A0AC34GFB3_9BILA